MRPFPWFLGCVFAASSAAVFTGDQARGQTALPLPHALTKASVAKPDGLRVTHVSLYKNGVGFFEHEGVVSGDQTVGLDLTSSQLNDVLQTLTAIDLGGGHITGANYNSTTPLAQQLGTLPLSLGEQPSMEQLYAALRGARVEVTGSGAAFTGRILSLEIVDAQSGEDKNKSVVEQNLLTVVADSGATRTLLLTPSTTVRLLDAGLRTDLNTYLELLDRHRAEDVRHLSLSVRGTGTRQLRVSFLSEVPVWKATYRLLTTTGATAQTKATLQGFSVVDNTTGEDWINVRLSLIAGNPQSFLQPLAQPIYNRRQEVPIAANVQMTPQTHESAEDPLASSYVAGAPVAVEAAPASVESYLRTGHGSGNGSGTGTSVSGGVRNRNVQPVMMADRAVEPMAIGGPLPMPYETKARDSVVPSTTIAAFDDLFEYNVSDPVTIPRNGSALVPILQVQVPTESVTLWSPSEPRPLRALWVTNTSQLTLDRGSFSVVEDGAFAGEGLVEPVHAGERRLLSYAMDEAVRVTPKDRKDTHRITSVSVSKGVLRAANTEVSDVEYTVSNAAAGARTVVIEEPRRQGWELDPEDKPAETTPGEYRFRVVATTSAPADLKITQRHTVDQYYQLTDSSEEQLTLYLRGNGASEGVVAQLEPVFAAKRAVASLDQRIHDTQARIDAVGSDQKRLRDNLGALKTSSEERALIRRYTGELNVQEDTLAALKKELTDLQTQRDAAQAVLSQRIDSLQIG